MPSVLVVHGHFYQPPRENPWTEEVDQEPSAEPYHDWNARISAECYTANGYARLYDAAGRIDRVLNTYGKISFNFGPTLMRWLERNEPDTYARILAGDRESSARLGHGNAIAQAYNHMILPLATPRDRRTQIRWGIADFVWRFGRRPEGMWLPETGIDAATLADLIDEGLRFTILAPSQALRVRPAPNAPWRDVSDGSIDPTRAYKCLHPDGSGRAISVVFYDGPIASDVSFGATLSSSQTFLDRIEGARVRSRDHVELLHIANDGETYGHHKRFGDLTLGHALEVEAARRGLPVTNYAAYLADNPPTWQAELKPGPDGEGTAWSCAHGVGRWSRDCGCAISPRPGWNQRWRGPLRHAFDLVRDAIAPHLQAAGPFRDPWAARDDYIDLVLSRTAEREQAFFDKHGVGHDQEERVRARQLLEMQRHAMLMYTSCGWFFDDVAGLEAVQVMKYAGRVLDLCDAAGVPSPREALLDALAGARSNEPRAGTGADVFRREVDPLRVQPPHVATQWAFSSLVRDTPERGTVGGYSYRVTGVQRAEHAALRLVVGSIHLEHTVLGSRHVLDLAALHLGSVDFYCAVRGQGIEALSVSAARLFDAFHKAPLPRLFRALDDFGEVELGIEHLLPDVRQELLDEVIAEIAQRYANAYARLHDEHARTLDILRAVGYRLPPVIRAAGEITLARRFAEIVEEITADLAPGAAHDGKREEDARMLAHEIQALGYQIDVRRAAGAIEVAIGERLRAFAGGQLPSGLEGAVRLVRLARDLRLDVDLRQGQNVIHHLVPELTTRPATCALCVELGFALPA